jgi:hypothetical protein
MSGDNEEPLKDTKGGLAQDGNKNRQKTTTNICL